MWGVAFKARVFLAMHLNGVIDKVAGSHLNS